MIEATDLKQAARHIFLETLEKIDAGVAVRNAVRISGNELFINGKKPDVRRGIYVAAIGKAAFPMIAEFNRIAGEYIKRGVVSGVRTADAVGKKFADFEGGHPLPNRESLRAAAACLSLLEEAAVEKAAVVFLISGGGSAMMEMPADPTISLSDLREMNGVLVASGVPIAEVNAVRRAVSAVKGGGLALRAADCEQFSLIISDTRSGDITSVASGPSLSPVENSPNAVEVIRKYGLEHKLPHSVIEYLRSKKTRFAADIRSSVCVLMDNRTAVEHAAAVAEDLGFAVRTDPAERDDEVVSGVEALLEKVLELRTSVPQDRPVCFISGGEFGCEVKGNGIGGRNCESVLRFALLAEERDVQQSLVFLSGGTDGVDGNSPAAGGLVDANTLAGRRSEAETFLRNSDSFTFLEKYGAAVKTGPTGTNVRDIRIILMR